MNKARKKKKQKAEEDDILASDNEDEEYREGAPDEDVPQQEEPEQENGVDSGSHQPEQRKAYAGTGGHLFTCGNHIWPPSPLQLGRCCTELHYVVGHGSSR